MTSHQALQLTSRQIVADLLGRGWTLSEIARRIGVNKSTLGRINAGTRTLSEFNYRRLVQLAIARHR